MADEGNLAGRSNFRPRLWRPRRYVTGPNPELDSAIYLAAAERQFEDALTATQATRRFHQLWAANYANVPTNEQYAVLWPATNAEQPASADYETPYRATNRSNALQVANDPDPQTFPWYAYYRTATQDYGRFLANQGVQVPPVPEDINLRRAADLRTDQTIPPMVPADLRAPEPRRARDFVRAAGRAIALGVNPDDIMDNFVGQWHAAAMPNNAVLDPEARNFASIAGIHHQHDYPPAEGASIYAPASDNDPLFELDTIYRALSDRRNPAASVEFGQRPFDGYEAPEGYDLAYYVAPFLSPLDVSNTQQFMQSLLARQAPDYNGRDSVASIAAHRLNQTNLVGVEVVYRNNPNLAPTDEGSASDYSGSTTPGGQPKRRRIEDDDLPMTFYIENDGTVRPLITSYARSPSNGDGSVAMLSASSGASQSESQSASQRSGSLTPSEVSQSGSEYTGLSTSSSISHRPDERASFSTTPSDFARSGEGRWVVQPGGTTEVWQDGSDAASRASSYSRSGTFATTPSVPGSRASTPRPEYYHEMRSMFNSRRSRHEVNLMDPAWHAQMLNRPHFSTPPLQEGGSIGPPASSPRSASSRGIPLSARGVSSVSTQGSPAPSSPSGSVHGSVPGTPPPPPPAGFNWDAVFSNAVVPMLNLQEDQP